LSPEELGAINQQLDDLFAAAPKSVRAGQPSPQELSEHALLSDLANVGGQLLGLVIPRYIQADLSVGGRFLEIGVDEALLGYPWELMHDGENFLCLKNFIGRFVNASSVGPPRNQSQFGWGQGEKLAVLLISVPNPQPRGDVTYDPLPAAEAETQAILDVLSTIPEVKHVTLTGKKATYNEVWKALRNDQYHIIHYNGHAHFNDQRPKLSSLVLYDQDMTTGPVINFFGKVPPVLCFVNACETGLTSGADWRNRYNIFGIARAFLETGAYLVGSRWKL
jgi:CHAT domain-containing protein